MSRPNSRLEPEGILVRDDEEDATSPGVRTQESAYPAMSWGNRRSSTDGRDAGSSGKVAGWWSSGLLRAPYRACPVQIGAGRRCPVEVGRPRPSTRVPVPPEKRRVYCAERVLGSRAGSSERYSPGRAGVDELAARVRNRSGDRRSPRLPARPHSRRKRDDDVAPGARPSGDRSSLTRATPTGPAVRTLRRVGRSGAAVRCWGPPRRPVNRSSLYARRCDPTARDCAERAPE